MTIYINRPNLPDPALFAFRMELELIAKFEEQKLFLLEKMNRDGNQLSVGKVKKVLREMKQTLTKVSIDEDARARLSLLCNYSTRGRK